MRYCKNCVSPDTRPGISIDINGICSGCYGQSLKEEKINWEERKKKFITICKNAKTISNNYDCIVPISGGKDSCFQLHVLVKKYNIKPLAVTFSHNWFTEVGKKNLWNIYQKVQ